MICFVSWSIPNLQRKIESLNVNLRCTSTDHIIQIFTVWAQWQVSAALWRYPSFWRHCQRFHIFDLDIASRQSSHGENTYPCVPLNRRVRHFSVVQGSNTKICQTVRSHIQNHMHSNCFCCVFVRKNILKWCFECIEWHIAMLVLTVLESRRVHSVSQITKIANIVTISMRKSTYFDQWHLEFRM